ncbi:MAG TPA: phosphotransferase [Gammaproteobacteria bacterium]|nr:phosphotransferase [Gammaproteobacteria bacterium]
MLTIHNSADIKKIASRLLENEMYTDRLFIKRLSGGGNNKSYLVKIEDNKYFLKHYFKDSNKYSRLSVEYSFLSFAWNNGIFCVPKPINSDNQCGIGIYEYINGKKLKKNEIKQNEIQQALDFIVALNEKKCLMKAGNLSIASDASFSMIAYIRSVENRISKLKSFNANDGIDFEVKQFINKDLAPKWNEVKHSIFIKLKREGTLLKKIQISDRILSPSDFGFHNALVQMNHQIKFIDFEYAGWDDPAKLVCDFFSQPAVPVSMDYFDTFLQEISNITKDPQATIYRVYVLLPLVQIKWCCIILNCFVIAFQARKNFACVITNKYRSAQLKKAKKIIGVMNDAS